MADQFQAKIEWLSKSPLVAGRHYKLKTAGQLIGASITTLKYREDLHSQEKLSVKTIAEHDVVVVNLSLNKDLPINFDDAAPGMREFVLLDAVSDTVLGKGLFDFALYRATNIPWQTLTINKSARAAMKQQQPYCIWFTGLSGSGKSTLANALEQHLHTQGRHTYLLDGDNVRHGLNRDLGFTEADRVENIRRVSEVAKLMVDAGLIVLVSFISPFRSERKLARSLFLDGEFIEVFVDTDLAECERRDSKGLYAKARRGELKNFTGIDSPYEPPENPEVVVHTQHESSIESIQKILAHL